MIIVFGWVALLGTGFRNTLLEQDQGGFMEFDKLIASSDMMPKVLRSHLQLNKGELLLFAKDLIAKHVTSI
ncbi:hypothetical protein E6C27_scaffold845G00720 [Cucumis melo var. makuwa]|uniref:Uncharacterized protein n=1 Tax=Cucumis melo var. makuwa TaxID=1194695 RepID=A0A5A7SQ10_CUCMM|nr:hypothetical protein E6C27_scaffold845G00720 [Cucumis melo var. makuwa]